MEKENQIKRPVVYVKVLNIVVIVLIAMVAVLGVVALSSIGKNYYSLLGVSSVSVKSDSMKSEYKKGDTFEYTLTGTGEVVEVPCTQAGFCKGDLIYIEIVDGKQKANELEVGDIITFRDPALRGALNTHRIVKVTEVAGEDYVFYITKGDANAAQDSQISSSDVVGVYNGHRLPVIGAINTFITSATGFLIFIVIPSFLILGYTIYRLVIVIKEERKVTVSTAVESEKEKIRQEVLEEMKKQNEAKAADAKPDKTDEAK